LKKAQKWACFYCQRYICMLTKINYNGAAFSSKGVVIW
jgi:hypothetical protein